MLRYHGRKLIRAGFMGAILVVLLIAVGLQPKQLLALATSIRYGALFDDAAGIGPGNAVTISGFKVGTVSGISLA